MGDTKANILRTFVLMALALLALGSTVARASTALLLEEPYDTFGHFNPTGHAAIYFDHICAESPTKLRHCAPGEAGVVVSRYHGVDGYDWVAIPLLPYLYAVDSLDDVPSIVDKETMVAIRDRYRRENLRNIAPDKADGSAPDGAWVQLVGEAYIRKIYGFQLSSTVEQDEAVIQMFNAGKNVSHFNLFFQNCADFSREVFNSQYPGAVHRNFIADFGLTTPKQVARSIKRYAAVHPELTYSTFVIPQVSGSIARSRRVDGVAEALVRSKKYVVPMAFLAPITTAVVATAWMTGGRFHLPSDGPLPESLKPSREQKPLNLLSSQTGARASLINSWGIGSLGNPAFPHGWEMLDMPRPAE